MNWEAVIWCGVIAIPVLLLWYAVDRAREKRWRRWCEKLIADAKAGTLPETQREDPGNGVISLSEDGFTVRGGPTDVTDVKWSDVEEIRAYKADLFSYDLICWGFGLRGEDALVEVNEEMAGFERLQEAVGARYGVALEDWWSRVAFPAFATNMTVIWSRQGDEA